jgi:hypothetical protein
MKLDELIEILQGTKETIGTGDIEIMVHYEEPDSYLYIEKEIKIDVVGKQLLIPVLK